MLQGLNEALHQGSTLVHCRQGARRSAIITGAYLMAKTGCSAQEAWTHLRAVRPIVEDCVWHDLHRFQDAMSGGRSLVGQCLPGIHKDTIIITTIITIIVIVTTTTTTTTIIINAIALQDLLPCTVSKEMFANILDGESYICQGNWCWYPCRKVAIIIKSI